MKFEMGPSPEQQVEVMGMNASYNVMREAKEGFEPQNPASVEAKVEQVRAVEKFIEEKLPKLTQEQVGSPDGFYSSAHMMANAVKLVERAALERNTRWARFFRET